MVTTAVAAVAGAVPPPRKAKAVTVATTPPPTLTRRQLLAAVATASTLRTTAVLAAAPRFAEIPGSGGVKALDLREGSGEIPAVGDQVKTRLSTLTAFFSTILAWSIINQFHTLKFL